MKKILVIFFFLFLYNTSNQQVIERRIIKNDTININKYLGYKYLYGGNNLFTDVDCSAFVQLFYKNEFDYELPRTTKEQIKIGKTIRYSELKNYDLIFFYNKYYNKVGHIAIYYNNCILHSRSSKGTTLDNLNSIVFKHYFKKRIIKIKRIL